MAVIRLTKEFSFEAAHALDGYDGPCSEISDVDLQGVANAVFSNERNMANEQAKVTKQKLVQLMCEA